MSAPPLSTNVGSGPPPSVSAATDDSDPLAPDPFSPDPTFCTTHLPVPQSSILVLITHFLLELGLHKTAAALRSEAGIGALGDPSPVGSGLANLARRGSWGHVLRILSALDPAAIDPSVVAEAHVACVLEVAEEDPDLAAATSMLLGHAESGTNGWQERGRDMEKKMRAMTAMRRAGSEDGALPTGYYSSMLKDFTGDEGAARFEVRRDIADKLAKMAPPVPRGRLMTLIGQAIKYEAMVGLLPLQHESEENDEEDGTNKKKKRKRSRTMAFDIVRGLPVHGGSHAPGDSGPSLRNITSSAEPTPISGRPSKNLPKLGDGAPSSALFLPDGRGIITASPEGFVEVWDHSRGKMRTDLKYQANDEIIMHDGGTAVTALSLLSDGSVLASADTKGRCCLWNVLTGRKLRDFPQTHPCAVTCLHLSRVSLLSGGADGKVRERGLRGGSIVREYLGHSSYITSVARIDGSTSTSSSGGARGGPSVLTVTSSGDGSVKLWDGDSGGGECLRTITFGKTVESVRGNGDGRHGDVTAAAANAGPPIQSVLQVGKGGMIVVPRGKVAYFINHAGSVLQRYELEGATVERDLVAGTLSPTGRWFYVGCSDGTLHVFDRESGGRYEKCLVSEGRLLRNDELENGDGDKGELIGLAHHPHSGILATWGREGDGKAMVRFWK